MQDWLMPYHITIGALMLGGLLLCIQLLVVDLIGVKAGHEPGQPITPDPGDLLFRAHRAHANHNESLAAFVALAVAGIFGGANASWLNGFALAYLAARVAHMLCYYADWRMLRSIAFGISLAAMFGMAGALLLRLFH